MGLVAGSNEDKHLTLKVEEIGQRNIVNWHSFHLRKEFCTIAALEVDTGAVGFNQSPLPVRFIFNIGQIIRSPFSGHEPFGKGFPRKNSDFGFLRHVERLTIFRHEGSSWPHRTGRFGETCLGGVNNRSHEPLALRVVHGCLETFEAPVRDSPAVNLTLGDELIHGVDDLRDRDSWIVTVKQIHVDGFELESLQRSFQVMNDLSFAHAWGPFRLGTAASALGDEHKFVGVNLPGLNPLAHDLFAASLRGAIDGSSVKGIHTRSPDVVKQLHRICHFVEE
mmetsp:Transcript_2297/g.5239  ORF Transcript_2297/g.5239 Transcript_2297/m.5239 type:complete len:279 (+) Transcript_2297:338-1174(+)